MDTETRETSADCRWRGETTSPWNTLVVRAKISTCLCEKNCRREPTSRTRREPKDQTLRVAAYCRPAGGGFIFLGWSVLAQFLPSFPSSFPKKVAFRPRRYKKNLNGNGWEHDFPFTSQICPVSRKRYLGYKITSASASAPLTPPTSLQPDSAIFGRQAPTGATFCLFSWLRVPERRAGASETRYEA